MNEEGDSSRFRKQRTMRSGLATSANKVEKQVKTSFVTVVNIASLPMIGAVWKFVTVVSGPVSSVSRCQRERGEGGS